MGTPEAITLTPEVDYQGFPNANGIRVTPDGKYVIFADTNDGKLYRMVPSEVPTEREISEIGVRGRTDSPDGLELSGRTLYVVNNQDELIVEVLLSGDYLGGRVVGNTTTPSFTRQRRPRWPVVGCWWRTQSFSTNRNRGRPSTS